jgi:integrase
MPSFKELINIKAEKQRARTGVIKLEQYRQIMAELADHLKPFFATAYWTGAREKELKFARRSNLKWNEKKLYLNPSETKPGQFRICGVNDELLAVLKEWEERTAKEHRTTPWLFHFEGQQLGEIKTGWNAALKRCGLRVMVMNDEGTAKTKIVNGKKKHVWKNLVMFHDARRSMNTILEDNDVDERDRMSQSGHLTPDQSRKYSQSKRAADRVMQAQNKVIAEEKGQKPMAVAPRAGEGANSVLATIERLTVLLEQGKISPERFELLTAKIA